MHGASTQPRDAHDSRPNQPSRSGGFVHLHLHSEYSLLDGGNRIPRLVERVSELGMDAVALTDHGNLFGAIEFYRACRKVDIKPILGIEAYVAPDVKTDRSDRRHKEAQGVADGGFHLVLLCESVNGWQNLVRLSSDSFVEGFYYRPRMDKSTLEEWNQGLIAVNGHLGSSIAYHLMQYERSGGAEKHYERAREEALWHQRAFGPSAAGEPRFYLELQRHESREQEAVNGLVQRLAAELEIPLVCDNDAHFLLDDDWDAHDTLVCVATGKRKEDDSRLRYSAELYVKSPQVMEELFADVREAVENTHRIAARCNVDLDFSANHAPLVGVRRRQPDDGAGRAEAKRGSTEWFQRYCSTIELVPLDARTTGTDRGELQQQCDEALRELAEAGLVWRYRDAITEAHRARLERELGVLAAKGISAYFLIVWDFVSEARRRGIPAMARGSGVGTMVGYVLGLSNACPVRYGLLFERFTDPDRSEYPDIDIDLCQDGRQEMLDYVREKYGYVAQIITFGKMKARAAIRDVGRVLNLPLPEVDRICKLIGDQLGVTLEDALGREPELAQLYESEPAVREVVDTARALEGMVRHSGVHAAGVVIATEPLENLVPLAISKQQQKEILVTQWDGPTVERMGLLKMDFLGLKTLSVVERARELVRETLDEETVTESVPGCAEGLDPLDLDRIDFTDQKVLDLYRRGETAGTFQFESDGMRNLLLKMKPDRLEDLVAANALFRPGPMALIDDYCDRKHQRQEVPEVHEIVDGHTADTYGIMVYQEQVMLIAHELGGIPLREAYSLIKAISKKKHEVIDAARTRFVTGAAERGLQARKAGKLFDLILRFAGYGFNKSHSVGYSILAYQTAYLKTYFPIQFMAAVLTYEADNSDKLAFYLDACKSVLLPDARRGIRVAPPDINLSGVRFHVIPDEEARRDASNGHIRFGLTAVKGVGLKAVEGILESRRAGGPFTSLYDFCERVPLQLVNRATIEALIKSGAFDSVHGSAARAAMLEALETAMAIGQSAARERAAGQHNLFGGGEQAAPAPEPQLPEMEPWTSRQQLAEEKAALGFYVSHHPLDEHHDLLDRFRNCRLHQVLEQPPHGDSDVIVGAMLASLRIPRTKKGRNPGQKMSMISLDDDSAKIEGVIFSEAFATHEALLEEDAIHFFRGRVDTRRGEPSIVVSQVIPLDQAPGKLTQRVCIVLHPDADMQPGSANEKRFTDGLVRVRELLDAERLKVNGTSAEVEVRIHLRDHLVVASCNGLRVPVGHDLDRRLAALLEPFGRCELLGPRKLAPRTPAVVPALQLQAS